MMKFPVIIGLTLLVVVLVVLSTSLALLCAYAMHTQAPDFGPAPASAQHRVFCFWTGSNPMSEDRKKCLQLMRANIGSPVVLVTPQNLSEYLVEPLHPTYLHLSATHKSDYLRAYFMHFHGGGYSDIKAPTAPWTKCFDRINSDARLYVIGTRERLQYCLLRSPNKVSCFMPRSSGLISVPFCICKPRTPFTEMWYRRCCSVLDKHAAALCRYPAVGVRDVRLPGWPAWGPGYPLRWEELLGEYLGPIHYKFRHHLEADLPSSSLHSYR